MSFDVFLIPSDASPMGPAAQTALDSGLAACGARRGRAGEDDIVTASGAGCAFYAADQGEAGGMFALQRPDAEVLQLIFRVADATACFIIAPGEAPALLRTPGNTGAPPARDEDPSIVLVADAMELAERLRGGFTASASYAEQVTGGSAADEDEIDDEIDPTLLDRFFKRPKNGS